MSEAFSGGVYRDSATGHPIQSTDNLFIPELWTAQLLEDLEGSLILGSAMVTNRNYEGEFRREGDVLHIPHFVDTVRDFGLKKAYGAFSAGEMDHAELEYIKMTIQKGSSFRFEVDRLHQWQTKEGIDLMSNLVRQRARKLAETIDILVAQTITAAIGGKDLNSSLSKTVPATLAEWNALTDLHGEVKQLTLQTGTDGVYKTIVDMVMELDITNAPQDRYLIVAPSIRASLLKDPNFMDASKWGATPVMPTGAIGQILGVPVYVSNVLANTTSSAKKLVRPTHTGASQIQMLMGSTNAVSLVIPHAEMRAYEPEDSFTQAVKSRVVYDAKVVRPEQLVVVGTFEEPVE